MRAVPDILSRLHVAEGATIRFARDVNRYPLVLTRWEGTELMNFSPLVYAFEQTNIAITGSGTLDGGGRGRGAPTAAGSAAPRARMRIATG